VFLRFGSTIGTRRVTATASSGTNTISVAFTATDTNDDHVTTPTFSPDGGTYVRNQNVTVNCASDGVVIHYTTNGATPTENDPTISVGSTLAVRMNLTLKAKAWKTGVGSSATKSASYVLTGAIVAGGRHGMALDTDGMVLTWGANWTGELGDGTIVSRSYCDRVWELDDVVALAAGALHSVALRADRAVWSWGYDGHYLMADGLQYQPDRRIPFHAASLTNVLSITAREWNSAALCADGTVWSWGDLNMVATNVPTRVMGLSNVIAISVGYYHGVALESDGTVWGWGNNEYHVLTNSSTLRFDTALQRSGFSNIVAISAGQFHTLALRSDGTVWTVGNNGLGQLGDGTTSDRPTPVQVNAVTGVTAIASGVYSSYLIQSNGTVWAWGYNGSGQLGDGTTVDKRSPVQVKGLTNVIAITAQGADDAAARSFGCAYALRSDGTVWAWGENWYGQVGDGTTKDRHTPVQVKNLMVLQDVDHDGLADFVELQLGTSLNNPDTDGDGMPDGWEYYHGLNPLQNDASDDPDGDSFTNLQEYQNGTDPQDFYNDALPQLTVAGGSASL
jgi:alpha-tubulin suppressor-like RCC1 family protein